ncbi:MAG: glycoside hydrolase family 3 C-terminal domain-containing protein, partial [Bifidobacteriaceae bacterium]|nr:glycoside hydrolase family 3 C-terminal domain-containing protein [Bifidobacteriaceae bacterium]
MLHTTGSPGRPRRRAYAAVAVAIAGSFALAGVAGAAITPAAAADDGYVAYQDQSLAPEVRAADLVSRMTLTEKIAQFRSATSPFGTDRGNLSQAIPRLGVKAYRYWNEAMHGVVGLSGATSFSSGLGIGATWNRTLVGEMGSAISDEARAGANTGNGNGVTYWAPTINLSRDPRWGREDESYSEDPYLTGQLGAANVEGMQGDNSTYLKIVSTPKHYLANNAENYRRNGNSQLTDKDLREYYTPAFRQLISPEGADAQSLMTSYNEVDGTPSPANQFTIETLARRTFGFTGFITSDCDAILDIWQRHVWTPAALNGAAVTQAQATAWAIKAGTDLACDGGNYNYQYIGDDGLPAALSQGLITEDDMDVSLVRDFTVRMRLGEFDDPSKVPYDNASVYGQNQIGAASAEHTAVATEMSNEAPVLLRNDPTDAGSALLPLQTKNVVTLGYLADEAVLGGYSGSPNPGPISTDQALTEAGYTVTHFDGITPKYGQKPGVLGVTFSDASGTSTYNTQPPKASRDPMWNWTGWRGIQYDPHATNPTAMMPNEDWEGEFSLTGVTVPAGSTQLSVQQISDSYHTTTVDAGQDCPADTVTQSTYGDQTTCTVPYDTATSSPTSQSQVLKGGHFVVHEGSATGTVVATVPADGDSSSSTSVAYSGTTGSPVTLYFEYEPPTYTVSLDAAATEAVRDAQAVIVDIGTRQSESSEEMDRATIDLPRYQDRLVQLARQLNPNVVVWIQAVGEVNIESFRNTWTTAQTSQYWSAPADGGQWVCGVNAAMRPCSV